MGIVMTFFMVVILLLKVPSPIRDRLQSYQGHLALLALLAGAWNVFWYGAQNLGESWGNAALVSGLLMMLISLPLLQVNHWPSLLKRPMLWLQAKANLLPSGFYEFTLTILFLFICTYAISYI